MRTNTKQNIGQYLLDKLQRHGVDHVFGIPGDYVIRFNKIIEEHPIKFINTTREDTAGYIADAYARMRGLGAACITYGVGINIVNATAQAYVEGSPLVIISGAAASSETTQRSALHHLINKSSELYRDTTQLEIFKQITIGQAVLTDPLQAPSQIDSLIDLCLQKKKPVYIELPRDIVEAPTGPHTYQPLESPKTNPEILQQALKKVESLLESSSKPLLWLGHEVSTLGLTESILHFAEAHNIPFATTLLGKSLISEYHPLHAGVYQGGMSLESIRDFVEQCDTVLALGVIMSDVNTGFFTHHFDRSRRVLATSPLLKIGEDEFAEVNLGEFVSRLCNNKQRRRYQDQKVPQRHFAPFTPSKNKISTARLFDCIQSYLQPEHIVASDIGDCLFACGDLKLHENAFIASAYFAALGSGIPMAIGAQFGSPDRRAVAIIGDGGCQMTALELSTAVRYGLNPIIIILNNHGYGTERPLLEGEYNDLLDWSYTAITQVLNSGIGITVKSEEECQQALSESFSDPNNLYIIEVELEKTDFSPALCRFKELAKKQI